MDDTREYGVVLHDSEGRINGFQEKPDPAEALSDLGNCGIYCFSPEIFDFFPERTVRRLGAATCSRRCSRTTCPFYIYEIDGYWNDVGSLDELRQGTFDALVGKVGIEVVQSAPARSTQPSSWRSPCGWGRTWRSARESSLMGPVVVGDGSRIGDGAALRDTIVFPGTTVAPGAIVIGAILGHAGIVESLRRR